MCIQEVRYEEGVALKLKYNMQHFTETNVLIEKETQQVSTTLIELKIIVMALATYSNRIGVKWDPQYGSDVATLTKHASFKKQLQFSIGY